jgi:pectinesterase
MRLAQTLLATLAASFPLLAADPSPILVGSGPGAAFPTLQAALDALPRSAGQRQVIQIQPGTYVGRVRIAAGAGPLLIRGTDAATTILTWDQGVNAVDAQGVKIGTMRSATLNIVADDVICENLTLANTAGRTAGQALALAAQGDRLIFRQCRMDGWQDTVRAEKGREYWVDCTISGHCDYIYGSATAWFERCTIVQRAGGYITAASTPEDHPYGFVFARCTITASAEAKGFFLGRPWRPFAATLFLACELPAEVSPAGWFNWGKPEREQTARYREFANTGSGAATAKRVPWARQLTRAEADAVTVAQVLGGQDRWQPDQGPASSSR